MSKIVRVILSPEAEETYKSLERRAATSKLEKSIFNAIKNKTQLLKLDIHYGSPISKDKIPLTYRQKYGITNLFRVELPQFWRMLYSLTDSPSQNEIVAFVIEISSHPEYNQRFGYRGH